MESISPPPTARPDLPPFIRWRSELAAIREFLRHAPFQVDLGSRVEHLAAGQTLGSVLEGLGAGLAAGDAEAGGQTRLIVNMDRGFGGEAGLQLVTELIGQGVNVVTGDYSRGAVGLWIRGGELAFPVSEVTIAGNLNNMLMGMETIGSDLEFRGSTAAPTLLIPEMTVGGR